MYKILCTREDENWLEVRRTSGIGSSESPVLLGLTKRDSPLNLFMKHVGTSDEPRQDSNAMFIGRTMEQGVIDLYNKLESNCIRPFQLTIQSTENHFLICTPDAWGKEPGDDRFAEIKLTAYRTQEWKDGGVPPDVNCQCQHIMAVTGGTEMLVIVLFFPFEMVHTIVKRDDDFINELLIPRCRDFWRHVETQTALPENWMDGNEKTRAALSKLYNEPTEKSSITLGGEFIERMKTRLAYKQEIKDRDYEVELIDNQFRLAIGKHEVGVLPDGSEVVWSMPDKKGTRRLYYKPSAAALIK